MSNYIIGLTGGIGSGKTTIANMFTALGVESVDADVIAREVVAPGTVALKEIENHFGNDILQADGSLNRSLLREKVFSNDNNKQWLNQLLHPLIRQSILTQLEQCQGSYCILIAPLLFENNLQPLVDRSLVIDVLPQTQIARSCQRDQSNESTIKSIINSQISREQRLKLADDVIDNEGSDMAKIQQNVESLHQSYLSFAKANIK